MSGLLADSAAQEMMSANKDLIKVLKITHKLLEALRQCLIDCNQSCKCEANQPNRLRLEKLDKIFITVQNLVANKVNEASNDQLLKCDQQMDCDISVDHTFAFDDDLSNILEDKSESEKELANNYKGINEENQQVSSADDRNGADNRLKKSVNTRSKKFICDYGDCQKSFADNYHLVRHIKSCHTLEKPFKCLKCDKRFAISERLAQHVKTIHKKDYTMFKCDHQNCDFQSILEDKLKAHSAKHKTIRRFVCQVCQKSFITKYELSRHKSRSHESKPLSAEKSDHSCDPLLNQNPQQENRTIAEIIGEDIDNCDNLNGLALTPLLSGVELKKRLKPRKYRNRVRVFDELVCHQIGCGKEFASKHNLNKHMRTVHSDVRPFLCQWPGCESAFKTRESLNCHLAAHKNERKHVCDVDGCGKGFNTRPELHQHRRSHGIKRVDKYQCSWPACQVMCQSALALTEHMNRHQNIRLFKCDCSECDKTFFTAYEMRQHVLKVHDKSESFGCDYGQCSMTYLNKRDLAKHRRLHQDVARFVCSWPACTNTFTTARDLSDHMNRHLDIKANKCSFVGCDRSYYKAQHLRRHIKQCHSNSN